MGLLSRDITAIFAHIVDVMMDVRTNSAFESAIMTVDSMTTGDMTDHQVHFQAREG
jgi:hypothetical protein